VYQLFCMQDDYSLSPTTLGRIASYYYLSHTTVRMFRDKLMPNATIPELITILAVCKLFILITLMDVLVKYTHHLRRMAIFQMNLE